jgi:hypothetical protein
MGLECGTLALVSTKNVVGASGDCAYAVPFTSKLTYGATGDASSRPQPTSITSIAGNGAQRRGYTADSP